MIALPTTDTRKFARRIPQTFECNPTSAELVELFFRLGVLLVGTFFAYLGYRLFLRHVLRSLHHSGFGRAGRTPPDVRTTPIAELPDETLLFLVSSRYCDSDKLADFASSQFGKLSGALCVQAICDFVHAKIRFSYPDASPTRCAGNSMHEGIGVCRDFAHLAIALCRCMNIPRALLHRLSRRHRSSDRY